MRWEAVCAIYSINISFLSKKTDAKTRIGELERSRLNFIQN